jgi:hypothetical protein
MKKRVWPLLFLLPLIVNSQQTTYDLFTYVAPSGWEKKITSGSLTYSKVDLKTKNWCQLILCKSAPATVNADTDFMTEWKEQVVRNYKDAGNPQLSNPKETAGWKIVSGSGKWVYNKKEVTTLLTTYSGFGTRASIVCNSTSPLFDPEIRKLLNSLNIKIIKTEKAKTVSSGYQFTNTHFEDGWLAEEKPDWVQVTKANERVLIHYANPVTSEYITDRDKSVNIAWNNLVAPRYSNLKNYFVFNNAMDPESPQFISGEMTENSSGRKVYVVLFHRGKSGWLEFISPDKASFIRSYGIDQSTFTFYQDMDSWNPLKKMASYNKFAVAATDIPGTWTNDFTGIQQYVYVYTGQSAGMSTYQSRQVFELSANKTYHWTLSVASGMVGNIKGKTTKTNGRYAQPSMWQISFSDISGKPAVYDAYFSCIKGARILWLSNTAFPGFDAYGRKE